MDFKYKNISCPICQKEFKETDDIVFCPECGAPYHRSCIKEAGGCIFNDLHEQGKSWEPVRRPAIEEEQKYDGYASRRCSRCGTVNPPDKLFCEICGNQLNNPNTEPMDASAGIPREEMRMGYSLFTTPFGGLSPDEEVDGVSAKELALYVRQNTPYFLPKIKAVKQGQQGVSWNWSAFIFDFYYLFYRKMWGLGIISAIVLIILSIPAMVYNLDIMFYSFTGSQNSTLLEAMDLNQEGLYNLCNFLSFVSLLYKFFLGMFTNRFYANKAVRDIKKIKEAHGDEQDYHMRLTAKGNVSRLYFALAVLLTMTFSTVLTAGILQFFLNV